MICVPARDYAPVKMAMSTALPSLPKLPKHLKPIATGTVIVVVSHQRKWKRMTIAAIISKKASPPRHWKGSRLARGTVVVTHWRRRKMAISSVRLRRPTSTITAVLSDPMSRIAKKAVALSLM
jgi:hypothetical protein